MLAKVWFRSSRGVIEVSPRTDAKPELRYDVKLPNIAKLLEDQLKDIYSAETQLVKALPKMAKKASSKALREAITSHLQETKHQVERLDKIAQSLGVKLSGKKCKAMEGLIEEGAEVLEAGCWPRGQSSILAAYRGGLRRRRALRNISVWFGSRPGATARA